MYKVGERVVVFPIKERGTVFKVRLDPRGDVLVDVQLDQDGRIYVSRTCELKAITHNFYCQHCEKQLSTTNTYSEDEAVKLAKGCGWQKIGASWVCPICRSNSCS